MRQERVTCDYCRKRSVWVGRDGRAEESGWVTETYEGKVIRDLCPACKPKPVVTASDIVTREENFRLQCENLRLSNQINNIQYAEKTLREETARLQLSNFDLTNRLNHIRDGVDTWSRAYGHFLPPAVVEDLRKALNQ